MEEIYKAIKALSPSEVKLKLAAVAQIHEDIEDQNSKMDDEIK
jgi:hypothetical protein